MINISPVFRAKIEQKSLGGTRPLADLFLHRSLTFSPLLAYFSAIPGHHNKNGELLTTII